MQSENDFEKLLRSANNVVKEFFKQSPERMEAFHNLLGITGYKAVLSEKHRELIAIALAVVKQCSYCIAFHVEKAINAGVSKQELLDALWVAVIMGGGPALMYSGEALKAFEELSKKKKESSNS